MSDVQRYDTFHYGSVRHEGDEAYADCEYGMEPVSSYGDFVRFEDYAALAAKVAELTQVMRTARAELVEAGISQNCNYNDLLVAIDAALTPADRERQS
jgi:hypothetical protein